MPATRSDLSGKPLEGSGEPTRLALTFPDGSRRYLTVAAAEAEELANKGAPVSRRLARLWSSVQQNAWKLVVYVSALALASLVIPAIIQQWTDRQKSLELKNDLVTALSELVAETTTSAIFLHNDLLPEASRAERASARRDAARTPSEKKKAQAAYEAALGKKGDAEQTLLNSTRITLLKSGSALEARLQTYFSDSPVANAWSRVRSTTTDYLILATNDARLSNAIRVFDFLCEGSRTGPRQAPQSIADACRTHVDSGKPPPATDSLYADVGNELIRLLRVRLLLGIRKADADGYSDDTSDLFWNIVPG